ncbi:sulfate permease [Auriscalpium vulgare]|uniref:Sulfate permease n=1 Tax=Auriscalpium vulgare TaxID=40419 RepID=A0ACB8S2E4_9AGAM|nr:sulfate permease [Auriscalpium vulgare]
MASATAKAKTFGKKVIGYPEERPALVSSVDYVRNLTHDPKRQASNYLKRLFPIFGWITRYNVGWAAGDLIAGLTVGIVVVPQSMSYAQIATLPPQYGLYSAFVGVMTYCLFATSKDVSIGPVAVMSLQVSQIIKYVNDHHPNEWSSPEIATALAFICGFIVLGIGLLRLGWIVELIPLPAVSGFMTGSAINIAVGQVPGLMGITGFECVAPHPYIPNINTSNSTRAATYHVVINTLKGLGRTQKDAAFGLVGLFFLYAIRITCDRLSRRYPRRARIFFFISVFRNAFVIVVLTLAAWLYTRHRKSAKGKYPIKILQTVPRGFKNVGSPSLPRSLLSALAPKFPVATIILLLEHIAISKSFGRINGYKIDPNQELIAIGVTNTVGSVFNAYPATGSFSRSALKSKSGVRTPLAGILSGIVVIVALYGLTPAFFWIPTAALSAVIIHAVADLVAKPSQVYAFWRVSPLEFVIWFAAVLTTIFSSIENGIYVSICTSAALLIVRLAHPRGHFLGRVRVHSEGTTADARDVFVPLRSNSVINPQVRVEPPPRGVLVYRFEDSFIYPNSSLLNSTLVDYVKGNTRRGKDVRLIPLGDRPWNDPGPRHGAQEEWERNEALPRLHAIVLDFSTISQIDTTAVQALVDTRVEVEKWVDGPVEFHFATILSPWIRRALVAGGFGLGRTASTLHRELAALDPYAAAAAPGPDVPNPTDVEAKAPPEVPVHQGSYGANAGAEAGVIQADTPFFHLDLPSAVAAAESGLTQLSREHSTSSRGDEGKDVKHRID